MRRLRRREVLVGLSAVGLGSGLAGVAGGRTAAGLADDERLNGSLVAGGVDLVVEGGGRTVNGPVGTVAVEGAEKTRVSARLPADSNPAAVWLRADCPTPASDVDVTVAYCDGGPLAGATDDEPLADVASYLRSGVRLDGGRADGCLAPGEDVCLEVTWEAGSAPELDWSFTFAAVQCRYDDGSNPFAAAPTEPCAGPDPCECCVAVGKLNLPDSGTLAVGEYVLDSDAGNDTEGTGAYRLVVTETVENDEGETVGVAFRLEANDDGPAPRLCGVELKGGPGWAGGERTYSRTDRATSGPATGGVLYGVEKHGNAYYGISNVVVGACTDETRHGCPDHPRWATGGHGGPDWGIETDGSHSDGPNDWPDADTDDGGVPPTQEEHEK